jgi:hypothetical protein
MTVRGAQARITEAVTSWTRVTSQPHRLGGVEYVIGRREIGHIHGDSLVDIPFPKRCEMRSSPQDAPSLIISCRTAAGSVSTCGRSRM